MSATTGRYWVVVQGRKFCIEPIAERGQKIDGHVFTNGGLGGDEVKNKQSGGSIREEDSIITAENGFKSWTTLPAGVSPEDWINKQLAKEPCNGEQCTDPGCHNQQCDNAKCRYDCQQYSDCVNRQGS